jgi:phenylpropionate dioxygenase-like ring-hydroxylating dioxygenase large terminal subunit
MLINNWYVAAWSHEVTRNKPLQVRMLGCDFVLFRDDQGRAICLSDVCCHRGASLAGGEIRNCNVVCPYHGWEYNAQGQCVLIPSRGEGTPIPKRVRVDSYPTQEKYGWVWAFLGDLPESERPAIPDLFPEYDDTAGWARVPYGFEARANWMRFEENSLDTAHTNFVHRQFGARRNPKLQAFPLEHREWGAKVSRVKPAPGADQKTGELAKLLSADRKDTRVELEFSLVGLCHRIQPTFREGMSQINFTARTPVEQKLSRAFGWQARNYLKEPQYDAERIAAIQLAVQEDLSVVEKVKPVLTPPSLSDEFLVETDSMEVAFRRCCWRWAARGWEIDVEEMERAGRDQVFVIPSPARREDPKNWVHRPVPLRQSTPEAARVAGGINAD